MKKKLPRILACLMACLIALNTIAIPKANAVVGGMLANMCLSAYMSATGISMVPDDETGEAIITFIDSLIPEFIEEKANEVGYVTVQAYKQALEDGCFIYGDGLIKITQEAAVLMGKFCGWLISNYELETEDYKPNFSIALDLYYPSGTPVVVYPTRVFPNVSEFGGYDNIFDFGLDFTTPNGYSWKSSETSSGNKTIRVYHPMGGRMVDVSTGSGGLHGHPFDKNWSYYIDESMVGAFDGSDQYVVTLITWCSCGKSKADNTISVVDIYSRYPLLGGELTKVTNVGLALTDDYDGIVLPDEDHSLVIDTGLRGYDEESLIDSVFANIANTTFSPTISTEKETSPDTTLPDDVIPDEELDSAGVLGWLKYIAQSIKALPKAIAEAVANIFVPDTALMHEITSVFSNKFGFVSDLHALAVDLRELDADSEPPVIYIHLEDAEGSIDYGGTVKALDMAWFARYKEDVDRITSGFLWLGFLWLCFMRVSDIINGAGLVYGLGTPPDHIDFHIDNTPKLEGRKRKR